MKTFTEDTFQGRSDISGLTDQVIAMFQKHAGDVPIRPLVKYGNTTLAEILRNNGMAMSTSGEEISWGGGGGGSSYVVCCDTKPR